MTELVKIDFTNDQVDLIKKQIAKGASDDELKLFLSVCKTRGLDPFKRHIYCIMRPFKDKKTNQWSEKMSIEVSIDGFRYIADRTGKYAGRLGPYWCGEDGKWVDVWLSDKPPVASKVGVLRHDFKEPVWAVARFNAFAPRNKDGDLNVMWSKMGEHMLAKVTEDQALRTAFPDDLGGLYGQEEMEQAYQESPIRKSQTTQTQPVIMVKGKTITNDYPEADFDSLGETFKGKDTRSAKDKMDQVFDGDDIPDFDNVSPVKSSEQTKQTQALPPVQSNPTFIPDIFCDSIKGLSEYRGVEISTIERDKLDLILAELSRASRSIKTADGKKWCENLMGAIKLHLFQTDGNKL